MRSNYLNFYLANTEKEKHKSEVIAFLAKLDCLFEKAPSIAKPLLQELKDQRSHLKLIASENYSSLTSQLAMGTLLTDKYSEGFPFHRFYAGCENVDTIESEAVELAKGLFKAAHAYVQPHSGADANLVAIWSVIIQKIQNNELEKFQKKTIDELNVEDHEKLRQVLCSQKILGLSLSSGGHLTHGYRHNISAKMMQAFTYDVDRKTGLLNYESIRKLALTHKPLILLAGYSAYPRLLNFAKMREIADESGAVLMVDMAHFAGLVAGKVFKGEYNPFPYAQIVTTTTHKTLRGPRGGMVLCNHEFSDTLNKGCPLVLGGPLPHVIAAKAIAFKEALDPSFTNYAQKIVDNAKTLAETLIKNGISVATDGTDNHLILIDLSPLGLTGRQGEKILYEAKLTSNRNMIPFDPNGPWYTSGVRLGTAALTTLGMGKDEMVAIGQIIAILLKNAIPTITAQGEKSRATAKIDERFIDQAKAKVKELLSQFILYPEILLESEPAYP